MSYDPNLSKIACTLGDLPLLESLHWIEVRHGRLPNTQVPQTTVDLISIPNLRHLRISGNVIMPNVPERVRLSNLTTLSLRSSLHTDTITNAAIWPEARSFPRAGDCINILRRSPSLQDVRLFLADADLNGDVASAEFTIPLTQLKVLHLSCMDPRSACSLLRVLKTIVAPSLIELAIRNMSSALNVIGDTRGHIQRAPKFYPSVKHGVVESRGTLANPHH